MTGERLTEKRWLLVGIIAYAVAANLSYFVLLRPLARKLEKIRIQKNLIEDYYLLVETRRALQDFQQRFITQDQVVTVIEDLKKVGDDMGVVVESVSLEEGFKPEKKRLVEVPIRVRLKSKYHNLGTFLNRLETSHRLFSITDLKVSADPYDPYRHRAEFVLYCLERTTGNEQ
ncbi:MAG TPA: hypothetical protein EYP53_00040 [Candidatus Latescibacteria bacterium]|nr:hypothetical protein [Candidatus Latescibacterota bacterium]